MFLLRKLFKVKKVLEKIGELGIVPVNVKNAFVFDTIEKMEDNYHYEERTI